MRILIDSHVALWWLDNNSAMGPDCRALVRAADEVHFSVITPWELGIKRALGKIEFPDDLSAALVENGFRPLMVQVEHAELAPQLPPHHRDPFDRMLIAQAQLEALPLVTADRVLTDYEVELIDARQ